MIVIQILKIVVKNMAQVILKYKSVKKSKNDYWLLYWRIIISWQINVIFIINDDEKKV